MARRWKIGLDFDNTLICYDDVLCDAARERGLVAENFQGGKHEVRDAVRLLPDGERRWMELQGHVYGAGIREAKPFSGVDSFLWRARHRGAEIVIISHKTKYGHFDLARIDLREAARSWMREAGFFDAGGGGIREENVHFAETRGEKIGRIAELGCAVFVDDLEEVLANPDFPPQVQRVLFSTDAGGSKKHPFPAFGDWWSIEEYVFGERARC